MQKRSRRKDARPGDLVQAALDLFVEKGFAATRVEEVAARAGVSKGTLFLYFKSKNDLLKAVVRESIGESIADWSQQAESFEGSSADLLRHSMNGWWAHVGRSNASGIVKLMLCEAHNFPDLAEFYRLEVMEPGRAMIRRILQRGIDRGEFRPVDVDMALYGAVAPMIYLTLMQHSASACTADTARVDPQRYLDTLLDLLLRGLQTTVPTKETST